MLLATVIVCNFCPLYPPGVAAHSREYELLHHIVSFLFWLHQVYEVLKEEKEEEEEE